MHCSSYSTTWRQELNFFQKRVKQGCKKEKKTGNGKKMHQRQKIKNFFTVFIALLHMQPSYEWKT